MKEKQMICDEIIVIFEKEKIFLNPDLKISDISERLGVPEKEIEAVFTEDYLWNKVNALFFK